MAKIKGMKTPSTYVWERVEEWYENCGLPNKHFIDKNDLHNLIMGCVKHGQKFSNHLRKLKSV